MANFQCPAGYLCAAPMTTNLTVPGIKWALNPTGDDEIIEVKHITATKLKQGADNKVDGGATLVFVENNGTYQKIALGLSGQNGYAFSDTPGIDGFANTDFRIVEPTTVNMQNWLNDKNSALSQNINQQVVSTLTKAGISQQEIQSVVPSTRNQALVAPTTQAAAPDLVGDFVAGLVGPGGALWRQELPPLPNNPIKSRKNFGKDHIYPLDLEIGRAHV